LLLPLALVAIAISYASFSTAGTFTKWPTWNTTYDEMAEGWRAGHLYLTTQPSPQLLAQPNPYDYSNQRYWYWDASLYKGHYYWYWAPFPGLLVAAFKILFRIKQPVGDQYPLFAFYLIYLGAGAAFIHRMARRLFPAVSTAFVLVAVAIFAYANPTPHGLATPGGYHAAIAGGQAFLLLGLVFAFDAVWTAERRTAPPGRRALLAASTAWGLAVSCRASLAPTILLIACLTLIAIPRDRSERRRRLVRDGALLLAPLGTIVLALLIYNKVRFDQWFEFGFRYQLNTMPLTPTWAHLRLNVYSYLLRPLATSCQFPFVSAPQQIGLRGFPAGTKFPADYYTPEPTAGLLNSAPWNLLSIVAFGLVIWTIVRRYRTERTLTPSDRRGRVELWCVAAFCLMSTLPLAPVVAAPFTTMRYAADIATGMVLFSTWGAWTVHARALAMKPAWRWSALVIGAGLATATVIFGVLLGLQGYDDMFKVHNPALYQLLVRRLSLCGS
jgi:hypothetical protein